MNTTRAMLLFASVFLSVALHAETTSSVFVADSQQTNTARSSTVGSIQHEQEVRTACIEGRRLICGRILELRPEGLLVECGYTNLLSVSRAWLIPATARATKAENMIEGKTPGGFCVGRILLTDIPKGKKARKPAQYDYVVVQAYPAGQFSYQSSAGIRRTVRRFSANLLAAIHANLEAETAGGSKSGMK